MVTSSRVTHRPIVAVDGGWIATPHATTAAARSVFRAWMRESGIGTADADGLFRGTRVNHRRLTLVESVVESRAIGWRTRRTVSTDDSLRAPIEPGAIDPWAPPEDLKARSMRVENCLRCATDCRPCGGVGRLGCDGCAGSGKQASTAREGRVINCTRCRGRSTIDCPDCVRRSAGCAACGGAARVARWFVVDEHKRYVSSIDDGAFAGVFQWAVDGEPPDTAAIERDAAIVETQVRDGAIEGVEVVLRAGERVTRQQALVIEVPSIVVGFGLAHDEVPLELLGRRLLVPPRRAGPLFAARATHLRRVLVAAVAVPAGFGLLSVARGRWYWSGPTLGAVVALLVATFLVYGWRWQATRGRGGARRWLVAALAPLGLCVLLTATARPGLDHAGATIRTGRLVEAGAELAALGDERDPALADTYATLRLAQLARAGSVEDAAGLLSRIPADSLRHAAGRSLVNDRVRREAGAAIDAGQLTRAEALLALVSYADRDTPAVRELASRVDAQLARQCIARADWRCAARHARLAVARGTPLDQSSIALVVDAVRAQVRDRLARPRKGASASETLTVLIDAEALQTLLDDVLDPSSTSSELRAIREQRDRARSAVDAEVAAAAKRQRADDARRQRPAAAEERRSYPRERSCCKVCSSGCACGDSCISCSKTCRKGRGCAC